MLQNLVAAAAAAAWDASTQEHPRGADSLVAARDWVLRYCPLHVRYIRTVSCIGARIVSKTITNDDSRSCANGASTQ